MTEDESDAQGTIHDRLREAHGASESSPPQHSPSFDDVEAEAAFWRAQFENERERLAKLWVAYKDLEAELELRQEETAEIAERKAAALLHQEREAPSTVEEEAEADEEPEPAATADVSPELAVPEGARERETEADEEPEARPDPFGDIHPVIELEGIGQVYSEALKKAGITDTRRLWQADAETVAEAAGASQKVARRWQAQAELMALDEVGPQYAELLVRSGITSIEELKEEDPAELLKKVERKQNDLEVRIQGNQPTQPRVRRWIDAAEKHDV